MALGALSSGWISDRLFAGRRGNVISLFMLAAGLSALGMYALPAGSPWGVATLFWCGFFRLSAGALLCPRPRTCWAGDTRPPGSVSLNAFAYVLAGLCEPFIGGMMERFPVHRLVTDAAGMTTEVLVDNTALVFPIVAGLCLCSAAMAQLIRR